MNPDYTDGDVRKMYEDLRRFRGDKYLERARRERPAATNSMVHKRLALAYIEAEDPALFLLLRNGRRRRRPEPTGSSPLEQLKARTSLLNPYGELTGGNFRSSL
jgi:hypothetical protein